MDLMINERYRNPKANTWNSFENPRVQGSLQAIGGLAEASLGYGITCLPGGITAPIGGLLAYHGLDHFAAGMTKALYGRPTESFTSQGLQKLGLSRNFSNFMDNGIGMIGGLGSANILSRGNFFKNFTNNFRFPINASSTYIQKKQILFGQNSVGKTFSHGPFKGKTISQVAEGLRERSISPDQLEINFLRINGQMITFNNRSLLAFRRSRIEPTVLKDQTGVPFFEMELSKHLKGIEPSNTIRVRGGPPGTSWIGP